MAPSIVGIQILKVSKRKLFLISMIFDDFIVIFLTSHLTQITMENWWKEGLQYFSSCTIYPITLCFRIIKAAAFGHPVVNRNIINSLPNNIDTIRLMLIGDSKVHR